MKGNLVSEQVTAFDFHLWIPHIEAENEGLPVKTLGVSSSHCALPPSGRRVDEQQPGEREFLDEACIYNSSVKIIICFKYFAVIKVTRIIQ